MWETAGRDRRADEAADRGAGSTHAHMLPTKKTSTSVETIPMIRYAGFDSESAMASGTHAGAGSRVSDVISSDARTFKSEERVRKFSPGSPDAATPQGARSLFETFTWIARCLRRC